MFSNQVKAILFVLAQALLKLYNMPASWEPEDDEHASFPGADMTVHTVGETADNPAAGRDVQGTVTGSAAEVFAPEPDPAEVFAPEPSINRGEPVYMMTYKAQGFTRDEYLKIDGWTDELLLSNGMMTVSYPNATPSAPPAAQPTPPAAPTPPTAPAPAAASVPASAPAALVSGGTIELDVDGLPWDQRIHSGGRTKTAKGVWTTKKNLDPGMKAQVTAELKQAQVSGAAPAPFVPLAGTAQPPAVSAPPAPSAAAVPPPPAAAPQAPASSGATNAPTTFAEVMRWCEAHGITAEVKNQANAAVGIQGVGMLARPEFAGLVGDWCAAVKQIKGMA